MAGKQPNPIDILVGRNVRLHRIAADLSEGEFARKLGISPRQVQDYENGTRRIGAAGLMRAAAALNMPILMLFEGVPAGSAGKTVTQYQSRS